METVMKIKMLESMAGQDFSLSPGEITDRFSDKEAKRFIATGIAEKAPVEPVKKPETKKEWDDERSKLIDENTALVAENEAAKVRQTELMAQIAALSDFKASVTAALASNAGTLETAEKAAAPEQR
jgi:hypothetical protein